MAVKGAGNGPEPSLTQPYLPGVIAALALLMIIGLTLPHTPTSAMLGMVRLLGSFYVFAGLMVVSFCLLVQVVRVACRQVDVKGASRPWQRTKNLKPCRVCGVAATSSLIIVALP